MAGNSFGRAFRITTAGEAHGPGNLVIIDGCPAGLALSEDDLRGDLARRRPGQSSIVTQRDEADEPEILSGVFEGRTTGTSIAILVRNTDQRSRDYAAIKDKYRPEKRALKDKMRANRRQLRELTDRDKVSESDIRKLANEYGKNKADYIFLKKKMKLEMRKVLTKEQREKQKEMRKTRRYQY